MDDSIASAVVLPEEEPLPPASPNSKRRQSSTSEQSAKRPRLDEDPPNTQHDAALNSKPSAPVRRERGRERRLFGAVLGALSQAPSTTAAQKRRSDIEKRQLAQRQQESEENEQKRADRIARRKVQRAKEQTRFEEQSMRLRHQNMLDTARFLQTATGPHLYYKPWETSAEEEERIQTQISEAHKIIDRELEDWEARKEQDASRSATSHGSAASHPVTTSQGGQEHNADVPRVSPATNGNTNGSHTSPKDQDIEQNPADDPGHEAVSIDTSDALNSTTGSHDTAFTDHPSKDDDDENAEDVVEEAAEDTVIY